MGDFVALYILSSSYRVYSYIIDISNPYVASVIILAGVIALSFIFGIKKLLMPSFDKHNHEDWVFAFIFSLLAIFITIFVIILPALSLFGLN